MSPRKGRPTPAQRAYLDAEREEIAALRWHRAKERDALAAWSLLTQDERRTMPKPAPPKPKANGLCLIPYSGPTGDDGGGR